MTTMQVEGTMKSPSEAKVGDKLVIDNGRGGSVIVVAKVTAKRIFTQRGGEYHRESGSPVGRIGSRIRCPKPGEIEAIEAREQAERSRRKAEDEKAQAKASHPANKAASEIQWAGDELFYLDPTILPSDELQAIAKRLGEIVAEAKRRV